ncbi:MAG: leucine-rich repeat domain-containing protein, partial [Peptococcaceae bacterium]|nr:leucine-rich repeat domain-containing protein [Peptococcaceae bacterium]
MNKKITAWVLAGSMLVTCTPPAVWAAPTLPAAAADDTTTEQPQATAGNCGAEGHEADVTWSFDAASGTLTISGTGAMADYERNKEPWYGLRDSLTKIVIDKGVTSIGANAFSGLTQLQTVSLPDGLTAIGDYAFFTCTALGEVTIPATVTDMGANPFRECSSLSAINLADGSSFKKSGNALLSADGTQLISYPAASDGDSFSVPKGVTTIQDGAFGRAKFTSITIPDSVTSIGGYCFAGSSITAIDLPASVTDLGTYLFSGCAALTEATIRGEITSIPSFTFYNCTALSSINITHMDQVTTIGQSAFDNTGLTEVTIPSTVTTIYSRAFANNAQLKKLVYESNATPEASRTFENCPALEIVQFTSKDKLPISSGMFANCPALKVIDASAYTGNGSGVSQYVWADLSASPILYSQNKLTGAVGTSAQVRYAVTNGAPLTIDADAVIDAESGILATPTVADGKTFDGWYTAADYSGSPATKVEAGQTAYAKYYATSGDVDTI